MRGGKGLLPTLYLLQWLTMAVPGGRTEDSLQTRDTGYIDLYKSVSVCSAQSVLGGAQACWGSPRQQNFFEDLLVCRERGECGEQKQGGVGREAGTYSPRK